jgi:hypothetical protein
MAQGKEQFVPEVVLSLLLERKQGDSGHNGLWWT